MAINVYPTADIIDSRDILERFEELDARVPDPDEPEDLFPPEPLDDDEQDEHEQLATLLQEIENNASDAPHHGVTLIADAYFETYAQEFAEDIGALPRDAEWPATFIDWERAANALKMDYAEVDWNGHTFWVR